MSFIDVNQSPVKVLEAADYVYYGRTDAEHGKASAVGSMPGAFQQAYTDGYNLGTYFRFIVSRNSV